MMPGVIEHGAQPGALATMTVANRSKTPLAVTVAARPWVQAASGKVSPNRRATLPGVSVDKTSFTLAPGAEQQVTATLNSAPSAGYLYGAIEAVGVPTDLAKRKGVVLGYRLVGALRILPAAPKTGLTAGKAKAVKGTAVVAGQEHRQHDRRRQRHRARQERRGTKRAGAPGRRRSCPASRSTSRSAPSSPRAPTRPRCRSSSAARRR